MSGERLAEVADLAVERKRKRTAAAVDDNATHHDMALAWIDEQSIDEHRPVYTAGAFYVPTDEGLWAYRSLEQVKVEIARRFNGRKLCKRSSDYKQIAEHASAIAEDAEFFARAPMGVTTPAGFYSLGHDQHQCELQPLTLEHRQQFRLSCDPDFDAEPVRLHGALESAFAGDCAGEQIDLVAEIAGAALFGLMALHQVVGLFLGREGSGKSTVQRLIEAVFPAAAVCAVSPAVWSREYNVASMAGKRLNLVGELSDDAPIPAAAFKNVTGGNLIEGRHPTHRPFYFQCQAAHIFASNVLPPTTDRTEAFFRRWRVVRFSNRVPEGQKDPHLLQRILDEEMPAVLAWAFSGAERVACHGGLRRTPAHDEVIARWKSAANPVLQFLLDDQCVQLDPEARTVTTRLAYAAYRKWASEVGMRNPFGRNHFLELVDSTGATIGVARRKYEGVDYVAGIRLVGEPGEL